MGCVAGLAGAVWPWKSGTRPEAAALPAPPEPTPGATDAAAPDVDEVSPEPASPVAVERERFARHEGDTFRIADDGFSSTTLMLEKVGGLVRMAGDGRQFEGYSLLFQVRAGACPPDGLVRLSHAALGEFEFYLGSVCGPVAPPRCEAVISRAV